MTDNADTGELNQEARRNWNNLAEWWDDRIGDGNQFQDELIQPATERLLEIKPGTTVLDIACGAGRFGRRMAELGAHVVAFDFSEKFIQRARQRTPPGMKNIEYHAIDGTDRKAMLALGEHRFDRAVATMALMDMADIEPLFDTLPKLLKPGGWFVFSVVHPFFMSPGSSHFAESHEAEGKYWVENGVKITQYLTPVAYKGVGIVGQPTDYHYFHRPLSMLLSTGFRHGFVVDGMEEPALKFNPDPARYLSASGMPEIPHIMAVRMRVGR